MPLANERISYLLTCWTSGTITVQEEEELYEILSAESPDEQTQAHIKELVGQYSHRQLSPSVNWDRLFEKIQENKEPAQVVQFPKPARRQKWLAYAAAAILILLITGIVYRQSINKIEPETVVTNSIVKDSVEALPGSDKATLTLSNGTIVNLIGANAAIVDAGSTITNEGGELRYQNATLVGFNTMTTPKGGQYKLLLSDGSRVWLNAASSVTYPTAFIGNTRTVSITGEAYFEVAKDKSKPFIVVTQHDSISVLGTSFNVNTYNDEPASTTTLLEGSVKINGKLLKPGQAYTAGTIINADTEQAVAWKNGIFNFNGLDLPNAMRQLARWYNLDVEFEGKVPAKQIRGEMGRDLNLSQVIKILERMEFNFRMKENKLIVSP